MVGKTSSRDKRSKLNKRPRSISNTDLPAPNRSQSPSESQASGHGALPGSRFGIPNDFSVPQWPDANRSPNLVDSFLQTDMPTDNFDSGYQSFQTPASASDIMNPASAASNFHLDFPNLDLDLHEYPLADFNLNQSNSSLSDLKSLRDARPTEHRNVVEFTKDSTDPHRLSEKLLPNEMTVKAPATHVIALVQIVTSLEAQYQASELAVDEVLRLNKNCIATVAAIVAQHGRKLCKNCHALVPTTMELIVSLYEKCFALGEKDNKNQDQPQATRRGSSSLQFGVFPIDPEDQAAFTCQLYIKELHRSMLIIRQFSAQCREAAGANLDCGSVVWYNKMEQRVKKLVTSLGR